MLKEIVFIKVIKEENMNYYDILGIPTNATEEDIKKAYNRIAKENHPDAYPNATEEEKRNLENKMQQLNEIKTVLLDEEKRKKYDSSNGIISQSREKK